MESQVRKCVLNKPCYKTTWSSIGVGKRSAADVTGREEVKASRFSIAVG